MVKTLGRKKSGPKAPVGGRVRVTVNLPRGLLRFVDSLKGRSRSDNVVLCVAAAAELEGK